MSDSIFEDAELQQVYELATGRAVNGRSGCEAAIVRCPSATHADAHPSCSLNFRKKAFYCYSCGANGGIAALVIAAGKAPDSAKAAFWLERQMGASRTPRRRDPFHERRDTRKVTAAELSDALARETKRFRERNCVEGLLHTREINAIRATVAQRYDVELPPVPRPMWEGGYGGRDRDPAWPAIFDWALSIASIEILGAPIDFGETLAPPPSVRLLAEDIAADAMRSLERDAHRMPRKVSA